MTYVRLLLTCSIFHGFVNSQSLNGEQCQSIINAASMSTEPVCEPLGDCTGLSCYSNQLDRTVVVAVDKCTDPLEVNVTVYDAFGSLVLFNKVTGIGEMSSGNYSVNVSLLNRNDFTATIMVVSIVDSVKYTAVPSVEIPLNASDCMCASVKHIGENVDAPVETNCTANSKCTGQECTFQIGNLDLLLEAYAEPCAEPKPGMFFIIRDGDGTILSEDYSDQDKNISFLGFALFAVTIEHRMFSIVLHGQLFYGGKPYNLIPKTHIIMDKSTCVLPTSTTSTATKSQTLLMPSQTMIIDSPQTCQALKDIRDQTNDGDLSACTVNVRCDTLECFTLNQYTSSFQPKPCLDPPGVHVTISDRGQKIYDNDITETTMIPVGSTLVLIVYLTQEDNGLAMKVDGNSGFGNFPIIQKTVIPCQCHSKICSSVASTSSSSLSVESSETGTPIVNRGRSVSVVAVAVPSALFVLVVIVVIVIIAAVLLIVSIKIRARNNAHVQKTEAIAFKRMTDENTAEVSSTAGEKNEYFKS